MGARERLSVERVDVRVGGDGRSPRGAAVGARERLPWDRDMCSGATHYGYLEVLQWARANGCPWDEETCACAAYNGHLEMLQWLRANGCPWDKKTLILARARGHLEFVNWATANGCPEQ